MLNKIQNIINEKVLIIDGAMGTQLQISDIKQEEWMYEGEDLEGCNELLNLTAPHILRNIHDAYADAGADLITTNTFGSMNWVLDEYDIPQTSYELSKLGAQLVKESCDKYSTREKPRFVLGSVGPGTKLPHLDILNMMICMRVIKSWLKVWLMVELIYFYLKLVKIHYK